MLTIEKTHVFGFEDAIRGMRNPLESWDKTDTETKYMAEGMTHTVIGKNDKALMKKLVDAGSDHGKFMRMINVTCDITAPLYWWKEYDTYKVGTVANSCSTMHKIQAHEFTDDMFSIEHLDDTVYIGDSVKKSSYGYFLDTLNCLNFWRNAYLEAVSGNNTFTEIGMSAKDIWWQMIQLLPTSYNQKRTVQLNYQVLKNIYHARKNHKLDEWHVFCAWVRSLPESDLITGKE